MKSKSSTPFARFPPIRDKRDVVPDSNLLARLPLLLGVDGATLRRIAEAAQLRELVKREYAIRKGTSGDNFMLLVKGRLQVVDVMENGREVGLNFLAPGEYFGELALIDGLPRSASVLATENSLILQIPKPQALALFYGHPLVAERLLKHLAEKLRTASDYQSILSLPNAFQRVFALLNRFARVAPGGLIVIDKMPTQQEIAITINTSRETVSRAIQVLIQRGVVEKDMRRLIVRKPEALLSAMADDYTYPEEHPTAQGVLQSGPSNRH